MRNGTSACSLLLSVCVVCHAADRSTAPIPIDHLYRAFFGHVAFLDSYSEKLPSESPDKNYFHTYYRNLLRLTDSEAAILSSTARQLDVGVKAQDSKAQAIIDDFRRRYPPNVKWDDPPRPPHELDELWLNRSAIIEASVKSLEQKLSAPTFRRINAYIFRSFSRGVKPLAMGAAQ